MGKTGLTKKTGKKSGHWNKEGAYFHHVSTKLKKDLSKKSRKSGKSHVAKSYPAGWSKNAAVREKHVKRDKAYEAFKVKSEQFKKSEAEHKTKVEKKAKAQKLANEGKSKEGARQKARRRRQRSWVQRRGQSRKARPRRRQSNRESSSFQRSRQLNGRNLQSPEPKSTKQRVLQGKAAPRNVNQRAT